MCTFACDNSQIKMLYICENANNFTIRVTKYTKDLENNNNV